MDTTECRGEKCPRGRRPGWVVKVIVSCVLTVLAAVRFLLWWFQQ